MAVRRLFDVAATKLGARGIASLFLRVTYKRILMVKGSEVGGEG